MNFLHAKDYQGRKVIDSRDVAQMVEKSHNVLMRSIRTYMEYLRESNFAQSDFFIESDYLNAQNHRMPCYLITKKGCDMIANKLTGRKGVLFTAAYVTAFNDMRDYIESIPTASLNASPGGVASLINALRRVMRDQGNSPTEIAVMAQGVSRAYGIPLPTGFVRELPGQTSLFGDRNV